MSPAGDGNKNEDESKFNKTINKKCSGNCFEVFRNNNTAVEVVIKQIRKRKSADRITSDIENYSTPSHLSLDKLVMEDKCHNIVIELQKHLHEAHKRQADLEMQNLMLTLEKEKLKIYLESKTNIILKMKKELENIKKLIKVILKNLWKGFQVAEHASLNTNSEYEAFVQDLHDDNILNAATEKIPKKDIKTTENKVITVTSLLE